MGGDKRPEAGVGLGVRDSPGEATQDHAHEDDGYAPHIGLPRVVGLICQHFRGEVWVGADNATSFSKLLSRVMKDGSCAKIDKLDNVGCCHDAVIKFEIAVSEADRVKVINTFADLAEDAVDLGAAHLLGHDDAKKVIRCILHNLHRWSKDGQDDASMGSTS